MWFPWHVLSKQRSCPLITGFSSIRVWVAQPRHQLRRLGNKRFYQVSGEAHRLFRPYKGTKIHHFYPRLHPPCLSILTHSSSSAQVRVFLLKPLQACLEPEASGWSPPSRSRTSQSYGKPDIWPRTSRTGCQMRGRSSLPPIPTRGLCFSHTSDVGWYSLFIHFSMD